MYNSDSDFDLLTTLANLPRLAGLLVDLYLLVRLGVCTCSLLASSSLGIELGGLLLCLLCEDGKVVTEARSDAVLLCLSQAKFRDSQSVRGSWRRQVLGHRNLLLPLTIEEESLLDDVLGEYVTVGQVFGDDGSPGEGNTSESALCAAALKTDQCMKRLLSLTSA